MIPALKVYVRLMSKKTKKYMDSLVPGFAFDYIIAPSTGCSWKPYVCYDIFSLDGPWTFGVDPELKA